MSNDIFPGFTTESFAFFRSLARNNHKEWFEENRERYDRHVVGVFRGLLRSLAPTLLALNPHFEVGGKTNGNFSRINRDIRFSKDKTPYALNYYLYVYDGRQARQSNGRLYVGLNPDCVTVGFATYAAWKAGESSPLENVFRRRFVSHRAIFDDLLDRVVRHGRYETYWHRNEKIASKKGETKKMEWAQHPGLPRRSEDWLTLQAWIVRRVFEPNARGVGTPAFASKVEAIFRELYPLYLYTTSARSWLGEVKASLKPVSVV